MQLCLQPKGARGIEPETFRRRGQLLSCPPTTGRLFFGWREFNEVFALLPGRCWAAGFLSVYHV